MDKDKELLTKEAAEKYHHIFMEKCDMPVSQRTALCTEMQERFGITELEALNILYGFHINDYINKYERKAGGLATRSGTKAYSDSEDTPAVQYNDDGWTIFERSE